MTRFLTMVLFFVATLTGTASATTAKRLPKTASDTSSYALFRHRMDSIRRERPTVALVLSGGGAKGAAHIGIIQLIDELNIPIDLVVGTSIGGLLGSFYACGYTGDEM